MRGQRERFLFSGEAVVTREPLQEWEPRPVSLGSCQGFGGDGARPQGQNPGPGGSGFQSLSSSHSEVRFKGSRRGHSAVTSNQGPLEYLGQQKHPWGPLHNSGEGVGAVVMMVGLPMGPESESVKVNKSM